MTSKIGACLYYQHIGSSANLDLGEPHIAFNEVGITLAAPMSNAIMFGVTQKYSSLSETVTGAGQVDNSHSGFIADGGITIRPAQSISMAAVMYNIYGGDSANYARALGFGVGVNLAQTFVVAADTRYDLTTDTGRWGAGAEYTLGGEEGTGFPIRAGYVYDAANSGSYITGGIGYNSSSLAIDAAIRKQVSNGDEFMMQFGIRVFLPK